MIVGLTTTPMVRVDANTDIKPRECWLTRVRARQQNRGAATPDGGGARRFWDPAFVNAHALELTRAGTAQSMGDRASTGPGALGKNVHYECTDHLREID
jgi:hypothetical protein